MHRHITYYTQSIVCQGGFSNKFLSSSWAYAGFAKGGQLFFFFGGGGLNATRDVAMRLLGGFGGMLPRKFFLNVAIWCVLEHIFINFLLSKSLKISFFFTKIIINCSHVLARGSRSMVHSPLIIFIKGCNQWRSEGNWRPGAKLNFSPPPPQKYSLK